MCVYTFWKSRACFGSVCTRQTVFWREWLSHTKGKVNLPECSCSARVRVMPQTKVSTNELKSWYFHNVLGDIKILDLWAYGSIYPVKKASWWYVVFFLVWINSEVCCWAECTYLSYTVQIGWKWKPVGGAGGDVGFRKGREREKFLTVRTRPSRMRQVSCTEQLQSFGFCFCSKSGDYYDTICSS